MSEVDKRVFHAFIRTICGQSFHAGSRLGISGQLVIRELAEMRLKSDDDGLWEFR